MRGGEERRRGGEGRGDAVLASSLILKSYG